MGDNGAVRLVARLLGTVGEVKPADAGADLVLTGEDGVPRRIAVKYYQSVRPSDRLATAGAPAGDAIPVVVAPRVSTAAATALRERGISWAALDGTADINARGLHVRVMGTGPGEAAYERRPDDGPPLRGWTRLGLDVAEFVLTLVPTEKQEKPIRLPRTAAIADVVGHSQSGVAKALRGMRDRGWLGQAGGSRGVGSGWDLVDPTGLLDDWAATENRGDQILAHGLIRDPIGFARERLVPALPEGQWCLAGISAAELLAPLLTAIPVMECLLSVQEMHRIDETLASLDLREVERGQRIVFRSGSSVTLGTATEVDGLPVTSPVCTYADVVHLPGRGPVMGANLREQRLGF